MINVALDVHVRNSFVIARDDSGRTLVRARAPNTLADIGQALAPVERAARESGQGVHAALESTTNSRAIACLLVRWGEELGLDLKVDVLVSRRLRVIAESTSKCDPLDTSSILELLASGMRLPTCFVPGEEVFELREYLRGRHDLVVVCTTLKNRVHALLHRRGVLPPPKLNLFTRAGKAYLASLELDEAGRHQLSQLQEALEEIGKLVKDCNRILRRLLNEPAWRRSASLLLSIPGIGVTTALSILAELGDIKRFKSRAAVANFAGLVPAVRGSNEKMWHGGLVRSHGSRHLRAVLVEAAWQSWPRVPVYADLYRRVKEKGCPQKAIAAVARRLLEDAWTILRKDEVFSYAPRPRGPGRRERASRPVAR